MGTKSPQSPGLRTLQIKSKFVLTIPNLLASTIRTHHLPLSITKQVRNKSWAQSNKKSRRKSRKKRKVNLPTNTNNKPNRSNQRMHKKIKRKLTSPPVSRSWSQLTCRNRSNYFFRATSPAILSLSTRTSQIFKTNNTKSSSIKNHIHSIFL